MPQDRLPILLGFPTKVGEEYITNVGGTREHPALSNEQKIIDILVLPASTFNHHSWATIRKDRLYKRLRFTEKQLQKCHWKISIKDI
uniref:Uncharacterized protein n=2 Tax=unclassified Prevotella TaxID=2638335 RepID=A0AB33JQ20_9BACT